MNAAGFSGHHQGRRRKFGFHMTSSLTLTPMLDMLTVVLIFLIVNYSPDKANIKQSSQIRLPQAELDITDVPKIQIEVTKEYVRINGKAVDGLIPATSEPAAWSVLKEQLDALAKFHAEQNAKLYKMVVKQIPVKQLGEKLEQMTEEKSKAAEVSDAANGGDKVEPILLIADKDAPYEIVDRTVAHLASHGYGEIFLLTNKEGKK